MSIFGMRVLLHELSGGSEHSPSEYIGQVIQSAEMIDERLRLKLDGGKTIEIWDDGQSCCEYRHITTDDDITTLVGCRLLKVESREGPTEDEGDYGECHESCFIEVGTDRGFITLTAHNEHNGYYGGFGLTITEVQSEDS